MPHQVNFLSYAISLHLKRIISFFFIFFIVYCCSINIMNRYTVLLSQFCVLSSDHNMRLRNYRSATKQEIKQDCGTEANFLVLLCQCIIICDFNDYHIGYTRPNLTKEDQQCDTRHGKIMSLVLQSLNHTKVGSGEPASPLQVP